MSTILRIHALCILTFCLHASVSAAAIKAGLTGKVFDWSKKPSSSTTRYGVSFKNKSNQDIVIFVENATASTNEAKFGSIRYFASRNRSMFATTPVFKAGSGKKDSAGQYWDGVNLEIDINQPTTLLIYTYDRTMSAIDLPQTENIIVNNAKELQQVYFPYSRLLYSAQFTPGKTIYVKWDGKKLMPQEGVLGKSDAGFSLKNNVTQNDIRSIR